MHATAAAVQVCAGARHGLAIAFRAVAARGARCVAVEDPSSPRMREIAAAAGLAVRALPCDDLGARPGALAGLGAGTAVVTPARQYLLGVTLSPRRRAELIAWACGSSGILIQDDYDGELRYDRHPLGALQALDPGRVIYVGTTSKSLAAGLRAGWLVVPARLTDALADTIRVINAWPSSLEQRRSPGSSRAGCSAGTSAGCAVSAAGGATCSPGMPRWCSSLASPPAAMRWSACRPAGQTGLKSSPGRRVPGSHWKG